MKRLIPVLVVASLAIVAFSSAAWAEATIGKQGKFDEIFHIEKRIAAPAQQIWPYLTDMRSWIRNYTFETMAGERNKEGEIIKLLPLEDGPIMPNPNTATHAKYYYRKTLLLLPFEKVVFKVFPPAGGAYGFEDITVFYGISLRQLDARTTQIVVDRYTEVEAARMSQDQWLEFTRVGLKGSKDGWKANLDTLERLVLGQPLE